MTDEQKRALEVLENLCTDDCVNKAFVVEPIKQLIQTQQEEIEDLKWKNKIYVKSIKSHKSEIEKKDTIINTMQAEFERLEDLEDNTDMLKEELKKKNSKIALLEKLYENLQKDFDSFKKDEDIHYLDGIHHKQLVEKSVGQKIDKPEECWFDIFEVKLIKNEILYGITIKEDFINLKQIADTDPENCMTVIAEGPLSGAIYRYNNYGTKEWQLIGTMMGYA